MNEAERETALFNCLKVPDDGVKLAVVDCLYYVPHSQLDPPEIESLLRTVENYQNIGVGQTELVLSKIFSILSSIITDTSQPS